MFGAEEIEIALRQHAVQRRLTGESPEAIAVSLKRSRQWVAKWTARYDPNNDDWARGVSRAPRRVPGRTPAELEAQILAERKRLEGIRWAQVGASSIAWSLESRGIEAPHVRTIGRVLARSGVVKREGPRRRESKKLPYPTPIAHQRGDVVQADFVGPRYLRGGVRFYALNQIDMFTHHTGTEIIENCSDKLVIGAMYVLWTRHGVPVRMQLDNGGQFVTPTALGEVVRIALLQGITLVFIPPGEPWRNGTIESFNDTFQPTLLPDRAFREPGAPDRAGSRVRGLPQRTPPLRGHEQPHARRDAAPQCAADPDPNRRASI